LHFIFSVPLVHRLQKGPIHTQYFCTQYWDENIKRHFSSNIFFFWVNWKYLFLDNCAYWNLVWKYFKMSLQYFEKKCLFIFLSEYCVQKYCVWRGPNAVIPNNGLSNCGTSFVILTIQMFGLSQKSVEWKLLKDANFLSVHVYVYKCMYVLICLHASGGRCAKTEPSSYGSCETKKKRCGSCILTTKRGSQTNYYVTS